MPLRFENCSSCGKEHLVSPRATKGKRTYCKNSWCKARCRADAAKDYRDRKKALR